jgi:hypothetical protein
MIINLGLKKFNPLKHCIICGKLAEKNSPDDYIKNGYYSEWINVGVYLYCKNIFCRKSGYGDFVRSKEGQDLIDKICKRTGLKRIK